MTLYSRVKAVWRREQGLRFTEGAFMFLRWGVVLFLAGGLMDWLAGKWLANIPAAGRTLILLVVLGVAIYKAWQAGWRLIRPFDVTRTALQIEKHHGGMESLLVTALQLGDAARRHGTSDALCDLACRNAEASAGQINPAGTVRFHSLRRPAVTALMAFLLIGVIAVTNGPLLKAGLLRIFTPWLDVSYPTRTRLDLLTGDIVVQEGKSVRIAARASGVVPRKAVIALRTGKGRPRVRKLAVVNGQFEYELETAFRGFEYRFTAGDARSPWHAVEVVNAPNITKADVSLDYPDYTGRATETLQALTIAVPETTRVQWKLLLDRAVSEAKLNLAGAESLPLEISGDGLSVTVDRVAVGSMSYSFTWVERDHGFRFDSPNHYLQVSPDQPPRVELTSPAGNIAATIGRKVDLAFRGRDDHGVAEAVVAYRVDKTEEKKISFKPVKAIDGSEQVIDWDYRAVLTNLVVGQTVSFAVELADAYPGENGPHRARSEARRIQFMTIEDYLALVEKQQKRLLAQLRSIYREEREVYETVMRLDKSDPIFIQTCQLEAVRQDLIRERIRKLSAGMGDLAEDLVANGITNLSMTATLEQLRADLHVISDTHVSEASTAMRALASESVKKGGDTAHAFAAHMINNCARELGLLVLHLGFEDAADVMGREMHAAAQAQAALRMRTITTGSKSEVLAKDQESLGQWLSRLFAASPKGKESSIEDALIEFTLTRIVKQLVNGGLDQQLQKSARLIGEGSTSDASRIQSEVVAALLKAEFRLRVGAEREALAKAMALFISQEDSQKKLRVEINALDEKSFKKQRVGMATAQAALHRNFQLLLMPAIPAPRVRLFDDSNPSEPHVNDLLVDADVAMTDAVANIEKGDLAAAEKVQRKAEESFAALAAIVRNRIVAMTQAVRIERLSFGARETDERLGRFAERQLSLLEKAEDAAADGSKSDYLADQESALADALEELGMEIANRARTAGTPSEESQSLPLHIEKALGAMRKAQPLLTENKPAEAVNHQEAAIASLKGSRFALAEHGSNITAYAAMLSGTKTAVAPSPYVGEIEEEQRDMLALTRMTKPEELPLHAIPQKNLIHAVDAILVALDPIAHLIGSGTVMVFAKDDMAAAGSAMEIKDPVEALDAQEFIVETLAELRGKIDAVIPQYRYLLEITEALHEAIPEGILIRDAQQALREETIGKADASVLAGKQDSLRARTDEYSKLIHAITGFDVVVTSVTHMAEAESLLKSGDLATSSDKMLLAERSLGGDLGTLLILMQRLTAVLNAPAPAQPIPEQFVLLLEVLPLAARQKEMYRACFAAKPDDVPGFEANLREFENACIPFIERAKLHKNPMVAPPPAKKPKKGEPVIVEPVVPLPPANLHRNLVAAKECLSAAAAAAKEKDLAKAIENQKSASERLRHFIAEYALKFYINQPGPSSSDPVPSEDFTESEDILMLFMPGMVTGVKPPDGKLEWEVLGRRDRAALNENFARELPLEYRAILKDYYERLAK